MKNHPRLLCLALAAAFALTACGGPQLLEITLPAAPLELATGETAALETGFVYDGETPENARPEVTYTSSDEAVATVDETGAVTALAEGEATITAAVGDLRAAQDVVVTIPVESLTAESLSLHLADGPARLAYTVVPENFSGALSFACENEQIAAVDDTGSVTPAAPGDTRVTITAPNGLTATAAVHVWDGPKELTLTAGKTEVTEGSGTQIAVADENGSEVDAETLTWRSSDEGIAVVSNGWVDMVGTGEATITASTEYGVEASVTLTGVARPVPTAPPAAGSGAEAASGGGETAQGGGSAAASGGSEGLNEWSSQGHGYFTTYGDGTAFELQNQVRAANGAAPLTWDNGLGDLAVARCQQIAVDFSHNGAQSAENIAVGFGDASSVIAAWQGSPGHFGNMISGSYTVGAIAHMYDGDGCHYWVAVFR